MRVVLFGGSCEILRRSIRENAGRDKTCTPLERAQARARANASSAQAISW